MPASRRQVAAALACTTALVLLLLALPHATSAHQPGAQADFAAPLAPAEAQRRIAAAQQAEQSQRQALALRLGLDSTAALPTVQNMFFAATSHHVSDRAGFLRFWREHGGALVFGYPIGEEIIEDGRVVQYFERARFEYHPELAGQPGQVQLSLLGRELFAERSFEPAGPEAGERYFPETGHTLSGKFLSFWQRRGGLAVFGYPLSQPIEEPSPADGVPRIVQYFERARFEYHPEQLDGFYQQQASAFGLKLVGLHEVQLADLGRQAAQRRGHSFAASAQLAGAPDWQPTIWQRHIDVDLTTQRLMAYEGDTPVFQAPVATGKDGFNTPTGTFAIYSRYPMQTMTGSGGGETWYVPDIPWVQYIVGGVAFHGTYWHDQWGTGARMSHGCVNLNIDDAQWLYEWADIGTEVVIHY